MVKAILFRSCNFLLLAAAMPFISGCNGGGGGGGTASLGSLFSASSGGDTLTSLTGGPGVTDGSGLATIQNPEPTTMLLVGGGMMAMAYFRNRHTN